MVRSFADNRAMSLTSQSSKSLRIPVSSEPFWEGIMSGCQGKTESVGILTPKVPLQLMVWWKQVQRCSVYIIFLLFVGCRRYLFTVYGWYGWGQPWKWQVFKWRAEKKRELGMEKGLREWRITSQQLYALQGQGEQDQILVFHLLITFLLQEIDHYILWWKSVLMIEHFWFLMKKILGFIRIQTQKFEAFGSIFHMKFPLIGRLWVRIQKISLKIDFQKIQMFHHKDTFSSKDVLLYLE